MKLIPFLSALFFIMFSLPLGYTLCASPSFSCKTEIGSKKYIQQCPGQSKECKDIFSKNGGGQKKKKKNEGKKEKLKQEEKKKKDKRKLDVKGSLSKTAGSVGNLKAATDGKLNKAKDLAQNLR